MLFLYIVDIRRVIKIKSKYVNGLKRLMHTLATFARVDDYYDDYDY